MKKILLISGSIRKDSFNTKLLTTITNLTEGKAELVHADISILPLFNQDLETTFPQEAQTLKDQIEAADAVIIATPEYNRSVPGVLKNAIDWASRPWGKNSFAGKYVLIMGATIAATGTAVAQSHLKQIMLYLDAKVLGQPELYISSAQDKWNEETAAYDTDTVEHINKALEKLLANL